MMEKWQLNSISDKKQCEMQENYNCNLYEQEITMALCYKKDKNFFLKINFRCHDCTKMPTIFTPWLKQSIFHSKWLCEIEYKSTSLTLSPFTIYFILWIITCNKVIQLNCINSDDCHPKWLNIYQILIELLLYHKCRHFKQNPDMVKRLLFCIQWCIKWNLY